LAPPDPARRRRPPRQSNPDHGEQATAPNIGQRRTRLVRDVVSEMAQTGQSEAAIIALKVKLHFFTSLGRADSDPVVCVDPMRRVHPGSGRLRARGLLHTG
jgi:hypothetical protein